MTTRYHVGPVVDFPVGEVHARGVNGTLIVIAQVVEGQFCAALDECPHLLLPLAGGRLEGTVIVCPHHASEFDLCSGDNLDWVKKRSGLTVPRWARRWLDRGKDLPPLTTVPVEVAGGEVYVHL